MAKIAMVFHSRSGSTAEIARFITTELQSAGDAVESINLRGAPEYKYPKFSEFDGIMIGSGIRIGSWSKKAKKFLDYAQNQYLRHRTNAPKIAFFISSGTASVPEKRDQAKHEYIESFLTEKYPDLPQDLTAAFGGVYDFSATSKHNFFIKFMLKKITQSENDLDLDYSTKNDFRDWDRIKAFGQKFHEMLS